MARERGWDGWGYTFSRCGQNSLPEVSWGGWSGGKGRSDGDTWGPAGRQDEARSDRQGLQRGCGLGGSAQGQGQLTGPHRTSQLLREGRAGGGNGAGNPRGDDGKEERGGPQDLRGPRVCGLVASGAEGKSRAKSPRGPAWGGGQGGPRRAAGQDAKGRRALTQARSAQHLL